MLQDIKAVIFDLDGTLVDSMWMWKQIDIDYLKLHNIPMDENLQKNIEGMSMKETAYYFKDTYNISDSIEEMMDTWNEMARETYENKVDFKRGCENFLKNLKSKGIKTGIATSNSRELLDAVTDALNLDRYIDCFKTGDEVGAGKPAPDIYLSVANHLNVNPKDCLVFEDIIPGLQAGINAGMKTCAVRDDYSMDVDDAKNEMADYYIIDYTDERLL